MIPGYCFRDCWQFHNPFSLGQSESNVTSFGVWHVGAEMFQLREVSMNDSKLMSRVWDKECLKEDSHQDFKTPGLEL